MEKWYVTLGNSIAVGDRILYRPVEVESIEEAEANAECIVKAVNCHDDLVEALKGIIRGAHWYTEIGEKEMAVAKQALARAEAL